MLRPSPAVVLLLALAAPGVARGQDRAPEPQAADDIFVGADTTFELYEIRSPITPVVWTRRRLVQTLDLSYARRLTPRNDDRPIRVVSTVRLRLDQEFGRTCFVDREGCVQPGDEADEGEYQPLARGGRLDAAAAWVEANGLPGGTRVRGGRQLRTGPIGFLRLDGLSVRTEPSPLFAAEAFGGRLVTETTVAGSDGLLPQSAIRLDLPDDVSPSRAPFVSPPVDVYAAGGAVEVGPSRWARGRVGFREVRNGTDGVMTRDLAVGLSSQPIDALRLQVDGVWDLLGGSLVDAVGAVEVLAGDVTVRTSVERHVPRFDVGTIWAWFDLVPVDRVRAGGRWRISPRVQIGAGVFGRRSDLGGEQGEELDGGFDAHASVRHGGWTLHGSAFLQDGDLGPASAVRLRVERAIGPIVRIFGRGSVWHFDDPLREGMYGTSFTEALGLRLRVTEQTALRAELEHSHSRVVGSRLRGLASLGIRVWR